MLFAGVVRVKDISQSVADDGEQRSFTNSSKFKHTVLRSALSHFTPNTVTLPPLHEIISNTSAVTNNLSLQ